MRRGRIEVNMVSFPGVDAFLYQHQRRDCSQRRINNRKGMVFVAVLAAFVNRTQVWHGVSVRVVRPAGGCGRVSRRCSTA
jgi:hypothetical protein